MHRTPSRIFLALVIAAFALVSFCLMASAGERKKVSGSYKAGRVESKTTIKPDDVPDHELVQFIRVDDVMISGDQDFNEVVCTVFEHDDNLKVTGTHRSYGNCLHKSGDRSYWYATGGHRVWVLNGDAWEAIVHGTWKWTGGTGKFASLRGTATYDVRITPSSRDAKWEGEVEY